MVINKKNIKQEYPYYTKEIKNLGVTSQDIEAMKRKGYVLKSGKNDIFLGKLVLKYCQEKKEQLTEHDFKCSRCKKKYRPALEKDKDIRMIGPKCVATLRCPYCNNTDKPWIALDALVKDGEFYLPRFKRKTINLNVDQSYNEQNIILTRKVIDFMIGKGYSKKTISNMLSALNKLQKFIQYRDYISISESTVLEFIQYLDDINTLTTKYLTMQNLKRFYSIVFYEKLGKKNLSKGLIDLFRITKNEKRRLQDFSTEVKLSEKDVLKWFHEIDDSNDEGKRLKCIIALLYCSGIRRDTLISLDLKALTNKPSLNLSAREKQYRTKYNKFTEIVLLNLNQVFLDYIQEYKKFLIKERDFLETDPLIPQLKKYQGQNTLHFSKNFIQSGDTISKILKDSGRKIGILNGNPHQFRHLFVLLVKKRVEHFPPHQQFKVIQALPKNLLHKSVNLFLYRYGQESDEQKKQILLDTDFSDRVEDNTQHLDQKEENEFLLESIHTEGDLKKIEDANRFLKRVMTTSI